MIDVQGANTKDGTLRLGEFLVSIGAMTEDQVREVLERQQEEPDKLFGQIAIELGMINDAAIDRYFGRQREVAKPA